MKENIRSLCLQSVKITSEIFLSINIQFLVKKSNQRKLKTFKKETFFQDTNSFYSEMYFESLSFTKNQCCQNQGHKNDQDVWINMISPEFKILPKFTIFRIVFSRIGKIANEISNTVIGI